MAGPWPFIKEKEVGRWENTEDTDSAVWAEEDRRRLDCAAVTLV